MGVLKGNVDILGLGNLLQLLSMNKREGVLTLLLGEDRKAIHFGPEGIRLLSSTMKRVNRLGKILLRRKRLSSSDLEGLLKEQKLLGWKLGQIATTSGLVKREDIEDALREQIEEEIFDIFMWNDAAFTFHEGQVPKEDTHTPLAALTFGVSVTSLLLEAARRADELMMIRRILRDDMTLKKFSFDIQADELGDDLEVVDAVLPLINGRRTLSEIIQMSIYPRFVTMRGVHKLLTLGYIKALDRKGQPVRYGEPAQRLRQG